MLSEAGLKKQGNIMGAINHHSSGVMLDAKTHHVYAGTIIVTHDVVLCLLDQGRGLVTDTVSKIKCFNSKVEILAELFHNSI